jgi:DNA-binding transcriptional LysR family regulator
LQAPDSWVYLSVAQAFQARGLVMPKTCVTANSSLLRIDLLGAGPFITAIPGSVLRLNAARRAVKVLPVDLQIRGYPVAILTLKNRILSPVVGLFIQHVREVAKSMAAQPQAR